MSSHNEHSAESRLDALRSRPEFQGPVESPGDHDATEHLALIYDSPDQQFDAAIPFIKQGLERDERCMYITHESAKEEVLEAIRAYGIDVDAVLDSGQLSIHDEEEAYLRNGTFDPDDTIEFLDAVIEEATEEYEALRVTSEMSSVLREDPTGEDLVECEAKANTLFDDADSIALCQYNRERFSEAVIRDILKTHPHIIYDETISQNAYYMPPEEFLGSDQNQTRDVDRMLETVVETTETKSTLQERIDSLHDLATVTAGPDRSFEERLQQLFELGCERFDLDLGVVARADPDTGRFEIEYASDDHNYFQPDVELPLSETFCKTAIDSGNAADMPLGETGYEGVTVIEAFGLQAPLGTYIEIDGDQNRVLFFVISQSHEKSVSDDELRFHTLLGLWLKDELERGQQDASSEHEQPNQLVHLVQDLIRAVTEEPTQSTLEQTICDRLAASPLYEAAWIGEQPVTDQRPTPSVWAGIQEEAVQSISETSTGESSLEVSMRAVDSRRPEVVQIGDVESAPDSFHRQLQEQGIESGLAIPIEYNDICYGVLVVYTDRPDAFTEQHRAVLAEVSTLIGFAIVATERREALVADEVVELEVRVRDPDHFFFTVTAEIDVTFTLNGIVMQSHGSYLVYVTATGVPPKTVLEHADQSPDIDHARLVDDRDDAAFMEFMFAGPSVVEPFAEHGGVVTAATAEQGEGLVTVELPMTTDVRAAVEAFQTTFPDSEVVAKRRRDRPVTTEGKFRHALTDRLTEKQRNVLQAAYFAGYFDRPRRTTGDELADTLDISTSTYHQHLQVGLQKLLTTAFDERDDR